MICERARGVVVIAAVTAAVTAAILGVAAPALADSRADARRRLQEGTALYRRGDYQGALRLFEEAQSLFPSPRIYFNIGQAQNRLGQPAAAVQAFERYLAEVKDADPARRKDARRLLDELHPRVGWVRVEAPSGSEIAIDGKPAGVAPLAGAIPVDPGEHQLTARTPGASVAHVQRVEVAAGKTELWQTAAEPPAAMATAPVIVTPGATDPRSGAAPTGGPPVPLPEGSTAPPVNLGTHAIPPEPQAASRRWWPWVAGAAVLVAAGVVTAVLLSRDPAAPTGSLGAVDQRGR